MISMYLKMEIASNSELRAKARALRPLIRVNNSTILKLACIYCLFVTALPTTAQLSTLSKVNIFIYQESSKKSSEIKLYLNGSQVMSKSIPSAVVYSVYSRGILQVSNVLDKKAKNYNPITVNLKDGDTYFFEVDQRDKLEQIDPSAVSDITSKIDTITESLKTPISGMTIAREIERRHILKLKAENELVKVKNQVFSSAKTYFEELKKSDHLDKSIIPSINVVLVEGNEGDGLPTYDLITTFTYDIDLNDQVNMELVNYPSGEYLIDRSPAAFATMTALKQTVEKHLYKYFEPGSTVNIRIVGSADSQPINGYLPYRSEFSPKLGGTFRKTDSYDDSIPSNKGGISTIAISQSTGIQTNEELAYLRSYGIRDFLQAKVEQLSGTRNNFSHEVKIEDEIGAQFRKIYVQLHIEDIFRNK